MSSARGTSAQRMPAWRRLGLKLKQPTAASEPANDGTPAVGHPGGAQSATKRKLDARSAAEPSLDIKRSRREGRTGDRNAPFNQEPNVDTPSKNGVSSKPVKAKCQRQHKTSRGPENKQPPADLGPALEYLRSWRHARDSWKFNKNHQSTLIRHVFDADGIPSADIVLFYAYIRDLKGFVRSRLREAAMDIRTQDVADRSSAFPAGTTDAEAKHVSYERLLTDLLQTRTSSQKRKSFDEADFVAGSQDVDVVIRRVVKRMRAEMILDELSDGEQTDDSRTTTQSSATMATSDTNAGGLDADAGGDKKLRLVDGSGKRRRKLRVNVDDSSSSSESESESGSDSSSDSSSDESDDDDDDDGDEADAPSADGYESSSSESSSSSSSGGELDSDDDGSDDDD